MCHFRFIRSIYTTLLSLSWFVLPSGNVYDSMSFDGEITHVHSEINKQRKQHYSLFYSCVVGHIFFSRRYFCVRCWELRPQASVGSLRQNKCAPIMAYTSETRLFHEETRPRLRGFVGQAGDRDARKPPLACHPPRHPTMRFYAAGSWSSASWRLKYNKNKCSESWEDDVFKAKRRYIKAWRANIYLYVYILIYACNNTSEVSSVVLDIVSKFSIYYNT